ncbi:MAG: helix-turn-helix domain-containing protein [Chloroflexi bacterium]|nr:helix-turn-helix domain-containing protein [Chloroflexota bacterium]
MTSRQQVITPESFQTLGELLRYLRKRAGLSQRELAAQVGYHYAHLNRIENNQRLPNEAALLAQFVPALSLEDQPQWVQRLLQLRREAEATQPPAQEPPPAQLPETHHVPSLPIALLGRQQEITQLSKRLLQPETRLVTLVGPPGVGKTSLALYTARKIEHHFTRGAAFIDLAPITDSDLVLNTIASTLGIRETETGQELKSLQNRLRDQHLLIVLDNFEQVMDASAKISSLMLATPTVKYLITSREALRIQGEREFPLRPLPAPAQNELDFKNHLDGFPALELFAQRAGAIHPDFRLTPENASLVAEICHRLDGLPLAIEFAASRIKTMSLSEMIAQLDQRLEWLSRGRRDSVDWRKTLRGALDWSYTLLTGQERALLNRLAVFSGGWTLELAQSVCSDATLCAHEDIYDLLVNLVDKSLVAAETQNHNTRYRFLDTVRHYALEKLQESGEYEACRQRHVEGFMQWAETLCYNFDRLPIPNFNQIVGHEYNNLRSAMDWALNHQPADEVNLRLAIAVCRLWFETNHFIEGADWAERFLPHTKDKKTFRARLSYLTATLTNYAYWTGRKERITELFEEAISLAREMNEKPTFAAALYWFSFVLLDSHNNALAAAYLEESSNIFRSLDMPLALSLALADLGVALQRQGDAANARSKLDEALNVAVQAGDVRCEAYALRMLAIYLRFEKQYEEALAINNRALEKTLILGDRLNCGQTLVQMAVLANMLDMHADSGRYALEAYQRFRSIGSEYQLPFPLRLQGYAALRVGNAEQARAFCIESIKQNHALGPAHEVGVLAGLILLSEIELTGGNLEFAGQLVAAVISKKAQGALRFQEPDENAILRLHRRLAESGWQTKAYLNPINLEEVIRLL